MRQRRRSITALMYTLLTYLGVSQSLLAEKALMRPQPPLKPSQEREDYQQCTKAVIKKYRGPTSDKRSKRIQNGISACRDRYPAVSIMVDCKKEMTQAYRDNHEDLKLALRQCREEYQKYTFNPKSRLPFVLRDEQAFFAGAGLNRTLPVKKSEDEGPSNEALYMGENFGNFSCTPLQDAMFAEQSPEFLLFGNDPLLYTPLRHANREAFLRTVGIRPEVAQAKKSQTPLPLQSVVHKDFGEITYDPASTEILNYPPASYCFFNRKLGNLFEGIKIYYLLDPAVRQVTPYFGVAFYRSQGAPRSSELAEEIRGLLGQEYQVSQPKAGVHLVTQVKVEAFDSEGDPKNLCGSGQVSPYTAIVHSEGTTSLAAYALLANTANLCRFGDRIASRVLKRGLDESP